MDPVTIATIRDAAIETLVRFGLRRSIAERGWALLESGQYPARCIEESKGRPHGLETGCHCDGCQERRALTFLMMVRDRLGELAALSEEERAARHIARLARRSALDP